MAEHLGDPGAVLVVDETGDLKKGSTTVGVTRQYTGTAGRVENAQVAVYLTYASDKGHAIEDRELYLPRDWTTNAERLQAAGVPGPVQLATKPTLATAMICRALDASTPTGWVAGDEVYGANPQLRTTLEARRVGYVLAVACHHRSPLAGVAAGLTGWPPLSPGAPGSRSRPAAAPRATATTTGRSSASTMTAPPLLYAVPDAAGPPGVGGRATLEGRGDLPNRQGLAGLDQHQLRRWNSWYRWVTLAMIAAAFLAVAAMAERARHPTHQGWSRSPATS